MRKGLRIFLKVLIGIAVLWIGLTIWVQLAGKERIEVIGATDAPHKALIVYNADPIYNLDEQVCRSFATGLSRSGFTCTIATVKRAPDTEEYDLYVFCANTYNWAPDWQLRRFIRNYPGLMGKNVVAITLGSGSTKRAKRILEQTIKARDAILLDSKTYWLLRPNEENQSGNKNTEVANDLAEAFGESIGQRLSD
jgi:hypothetical protein